MVYMFWTYQLHCLCQGLVWLQVIVSHNPFYDDTFLWWSSDWLVLCYRSLNNFKNKTDSQDHIPWYDNLRGSKTGREASLDCDIKSEFCASRTDGQWFRKFLLPQLHRVDIIFKSSKWCALAVDEIPRLPDMDCTHNICVLASKGSQA